MAAEEHVFLPGVWAGAAVHHLSLMSKCLIQIYPCESPTHRQATVSSSAKEYDRYTCVPSLFMKRKNVTSKKYSAEQDKIYLVAAFCMTVS